MIEQKFVENRHWSIEKDNRQSKTIKHKNWDEKKILFFFLQLIEKESKNLHWKTTKPKNRDEKKSTWFFLKEICDNQHINYLFLS